MTKNEYSSGTSARVKAFRDRLSDSSFKRVEAYVTTEEKSRIEAVKTDLGVTTDVAVAGLLRMGLEQYANGRDSSVCDCPQAVTGPSVEVAAHSGVFGSVSLGTFLGNAEPGANAQLGSCVNSLSSLNLNAITPTPVKLSAAQAAPSIDNSDNNPIARFFKHRKETLKNV